MVDLKPRNIRPLTDAEAQLHAKGYLDGFTSHEPSSNDPIYLDGYKLGQAELKQEMKDEQI